MSSAVQAVSNFAQGMWSSVSRPDKWFDMEYQSASLNEMMGGAGPEEIEQQKAEAASAAQAAATQQANDAYTAAYKAMWERDAAWKAQQAANAAAEQAAADSAAKNKAMADAAAAASAKAKADQEAKDQAAADAQTLLTNRRKAAAASVYASGGQKGLLGEAPVKLKVLLGQ